MNKKTFALLALLLIGTHSFAAIEIHHFDRPEDEARYKALIEELRCPKCQNQNLAGSDAPIAQDLKQKTYEMIQDGRSDGEIRNYMFEHYGDFISYKPPMRPSTWILWIFPPILLIVLLLGWLYKTKKSKHSFVIDDSHQTLSADEEAKFNAILKHHKPTKDKDNA